VAEIDQIIKYTQEEHQKEIKALDDKYALEFHDGTWQTEGCIIVVGNNNLKRGVISLYHNFSLAEHLGNWQTFSMLARDYWWPTMK
jgi:hypothetical protein